MKPSIKPFPLPNKPSHALDGATPIRSTNSQTQVMYQGITLMFILRNTGCYVEVADFVHSYGKGAGIASAIIAFVMLLTILFSCCLCCHPDQKNQAHTNYYKRMAYYDE